MKGKKNKKGKKMKKYILTLGLNDKDTCKPAFSESKAVEMVCNLLLQRGFKGASITSGRGFYEMESNGQTVFEDFIKIEFMFVEAQKVIDFANVLKAVFNQESIAFETVNTDSILL
jgi:hypothetical protein